MVHDKNNNTRYLTLLLLLIYKAAFQLNLAWGSLWSSILMLLRKYEFYRPSCLWLRFGFWGGQLVGCSVFNYKWKIMVRIEDTNKWTLKDAGSVLSSCGIKSRVLLKSDWQKWKSQTSSKPNPQCDPENVSLLGSKSKYSEQIGLVHLDK